MSDELNGTNMSLALIYESYTVIVLYLPELPQEYDHHLYVVCLVVMGVGFSCVGLVRLACPFLKHPLRN